MKKWIYVLYALVGICLASNGYCADNKVVVIPLWKTKTIEGNAVPADVLSGKTFTTADGELSGIRPPAPIGTDYVGKGVHPPDPRFKIFYARSKIDPYEVEQTGYGITDLMTGLIWMKSPGQSKKTRSEAVHSCENKITTYSFFSTGYPKIYLNDWRLPTVREFNSLLDYGRGAVHVAGSTALVVPNDFSDVLHGQYWTDTGSVTPCPPDGNRCNIVYYVNIVDADVDRALIDPTDSNPPEYYYWCVRGPYGIEY